MPKGSARKGNTMQSAYDNWRLAGPPEADEVELELRCGATVTRRFITPDLERRLKALAAALNDGTLYDTATTARLAVDEWLRTDYAEDAECPFDGEVTVMVGQGRATWSCPVCGTDHDEDEDKVLPQPDDDR